MRLSPRKNPHEEKLHNVRVKEEELRPLVALGPRVGLHRTAGATRGFGKENVFQGSHLASSQHGI